MAITVKHKFVSAIPDAGDPTIVQPSNWNDDHQLTGTVPVANGGTGASTANDGFNALAPNQTGNSGKYLTTDGSNTSWAVNPLGTVTSVATGTGLTGGPITTSGTISIDSTVATLTGTQTLTNKTLTSPVQSSFESWTPTSAPSYAEGELWYDSTQKALAYYNDVTNNAVHIGQEVQLKVINNTGSSIANGTPVYVTGTSSGQSYPNIALAQANSSSTSAVLGLTNGTIAAGASGYVCTAGLLTPCNTGSFSVGQVLYLSPYSAGQLMNTVPPTGYAVQVGVVAYANTPNGSIYVKQTTPLAVSASTIVGQVALANGGTNANLTASAGSVPYSTSSALALSAVGTSGQVLTSQGTSAPIWTTPTTGTVTSVAATGGTGISVSGSPITSSGTLTITNTAPDQTVAITSGTGISVTGTYPNFTVTNTSPSSGGTVTSVTGTAPISSSGGNTPAISISQATTSTNGYLSSTDWNTFNNKQPAGSYLTSVTSDAPLSGSGTTGSHLTISQSSSTTNGYLSSTDWNTFNNKGSGSVTSVALTAPSIFTVTGSPITSSGTLALTYSGTALPILNGGTGQTTANAAFNALAPSQTSNSGKYLTTDGTNTSWATLGNTYSRTSFTATASQTTFTVSYTVGLIQVYINGILLNGADYTATNGTSIVLAVGCNSGDIVEVLAFSSFSVASTVSSFSGGTTGLTPNTATTGNVTLGGTLAVANGGTGVTTSTGSGSVVLGTSPTIATPTITSLYGQNSNLVKTPYSDTGLIPAELIYRLNSTNAGTATTNAQPFLGVGVTLTSSTIYQFEAVFAISKSASTTAHNINLVFGGTATLNNIEYAVIKQAGAATSFTDIANSGAFIIYSQTASSTLIASNTGGIANYFQTIVIKGTVSINASGTFIPQYQTSVAVGPYTTAIGSYFKLSPLGASGSNINIGGWA